MCGGGQANGQPRHTFLDVSSTERHQTPLIELLLMDLLLSRDAWGCGNCTRVEGATGVPEQKKGGGVPCILRTRSRLTKLPAKGLGETAMDLSVCVCVRSQPPPGTLRGE